MLCPIVGRIRRSRHPADRHKKTLPKQGLAARKAVSATGAHDLVFTRQVLDRRAPDVNQAREREQQEQRHPQHQVQAENERYAL